MRCVEQFAKFDEIVVVELLASLDDAVVLLDDVAAAVIDLFGDLVFCGVEHIDGNVAEGFHVG